MGNVKIVHINGGKSTTMDSEAWARESRNPLVRKFYKVVGDIPTPPEAMTAEERKEAEEAAAKAAAEAQANKEAEEAAAKAAAAGGGKGGKK